jgi:hypothetical protein
MLRKKNATPNLHLITDEDARRAHAQKQINRHLMKWAALKIGTTAAVVVTLKIIAKKMEESEAANSED